MKSSRKVALILFEEDPIGLRSCGISDDEYNSEAEMICERCCDREDLYSVVYEVFVEQFGAKLAGPKERYMGAARKIHSLHIGE